MTEMRYVVTADFIDREEDGRDHQDGSVIYRAVPSRKTWSFPASVTIGAIMEAVKEAHGSPVSVTITEDEYTASQIREERRSARSKERGQEV